MTYNSANDVAGVLVSALPEADDDLTSRYLAVRRQSVNLCEPLETEDYQVQPMDDASPPKWHLAHVTWFFETFLLKPFLENYNEFDESYETLFNSYYNGVGTPFTRAHRGFLSRPTVERVFEYRKHVDVAMQELLQKSSQELVSEQVRFRLELGLNHEQQHQELILTDLKYNLGNNPLRPCYQDQALTGCEHRIPAWVEFPGGLVTVGADGSGGFVFDNETPRHEVFLQPFEISTELVTNAEFIEFIEDNGYNRPELWLSDGWAGLQAMGQERWQMPLYWRRHGDEFLEYSLSGEAPVDAHQPVCHVSGYEADAFARWKGARLPGEHEWEHAAGNRPVSGNFAESGRLHPGSKSSGDDGIHGMFGDAWEWTRSSYGPYPGYQAFSGQLGEYNGKFMANQLVLRGGSCASPRSHVRATYRNFFYPPDRWQFSGIRLARDIQ